MCVWGYVLMKIYATEYLIYSIFILTKLTDEPTTCKSQLFSFISIHHGHWGVYEVQDTLHLSIFNILSRRGLRKQQKQGHLNLPSSLKQVMNPVSCERCPPNPRGKQHPYLQTQRDPKKNPNQDKEAMLSPLVYCNPSMTVSSPSNLV